MIGRAIKLILKNISIKKNPSLNNFIGKFIKHLKRKKKRDEYINFIT